MLKFNLTRFFLLMLAACVVAMIALYVAGIMRFLPNMPGELLALSTVFVGCYSIVGLICSVGRERTAASALSLVGIGLGAIACALCIALLFIMQNRFDDDDVWRFLIWPVVLPCAIALAVLVMLPNRHWIWWRAMLVVTLLLLAALTLVICFEFTLMPSRWDYKYEQSFDQLLAFASSWFVSAALITSLCAFLPGLFGVKDSRPAISFQLQCPRCEHDQAAATGTHRCVHCGLSLTVEAL